MNAAGLLTNEAWLEQHLWAAEALAANSDDIAIGKLVSFLLVGTFAGRLHFCVEVQSNVAELLREITASEVKTKDGMWQSIPFINWYSVGDTVARVHYNTCGAA